MKRYIFLGVLFVTALFGAFGTEPEGVFTYKVGQIEIFMMVEAQRDGNIAIIPRAYTEIARRYIPETGFRHSTNAFLVKTPEYNILIDAGTGAGDVLLNKIRQIGLEPDQIDVVLITHLHADHFGGLQRDGRAVFPNAKIYISEREYDHFIRITASERAITALAPYGDNVITFDPAPLGAETTELFPGISPAANYGHTPGHTVYLIECDGQKLIIAGDFLHVALVQFAHPEIAATFDMNIAAAAISRRQLLNYAARNQIPIGGMHIVYPGIVTLEAHKTGYRFTPVSNQ